jgi:uncharacterized protein
MNRYRLFAFALLFAGSASLCDISQADDAVKTSPTKKIQVLVLSGGHGFPDKPFREIFASFPDMNCTFVEEKVGGEAFADIDNWKYEAIVLYNFEKKPSEKEKDNFLKLMDRGVGLVVLHHGLHAYRDWPEFQKIAGITSFVDNARDDVDYKIHIEDPQHPIVKGLGDFDVKDETYLGHQIDPEAKVRIFLSTDEPKNLKAVAWTHTYRKSPVCFYQLGHGVSIYGQKEFREVLGNAIRWSAGKLPSPEK